MTMLSVERIERHFASGATEDLTFLQGVNLLVGPPNTGKTKWLEILDYLFGDPGPHPFEGAEETGLPERYDAAGAEIRIGKDSYWIERRWRQAGAKTKVYVDEQQMPAREFQTWLIEKLSIPLVNFPKGNPMSGQTWPELTFRMLFRHIYRRQTFWNDIADKQPEGEQHACLLQFLGVADAVFSKDYGRLIELKMEAERLKVRREQYKGTLDELAREVLAESDLTVGVNANTVTAAQVNLQETIENLQRKRTVLLTNAREQVNVDAPSNRLSELGEKRSRLLHHVEQLGRTREAASARLEQLQRYRVELADELERLERAADAGEVLADLKITHCPACDQPISLPHKMIGQCFLCHQDISTQVDSEGLGAVRLQFERDRLTAEIREADQLLAVLQKESMQVEQQVNATQRELHRVESELRPARQAVSALVQQDVSAIDMALGGAHERQRHLSRVVDALAIGDDLTKRIASIERDIAPIQRRFEESTRSIDFDAAANHLEVGMNNYLTEINKLREKVWRHRPINVDVSQSRLQIRIGGRRWSTVLGGTDTLYFLMAYHYGLLTLSNNEACNYPGLSIIDVPGEFSGEAVEDKENFIVQPFIDLLNMDDYAGAQLIITGAAFTGLTGVHREELHHVYVA